MLDNNTQVNPVKGYSSRAFTGTFTTSSYDDNLGKTPIDSYALESQIASTQPEVEKQEHGWFSDVFNNFSNKRDEIRLLTERGRLRYTIDPELQEIESQISNEDLSAEEMQSLLDRRDQLLEEKQIVLDDIADIENDISNRNKKGVSAYYQAKEMLSQNKPLSDTDYWKYNVPGTTGSSFSDVSSYLAGLGSWGIKLGSKFLGSAVAAAGTIGTAGVGAPLAVGAGAAISTMGELAGTALQMWGVNESNKSEALAETFGAYKDKALQRFEKDGVNLQDYAKALKLRDKSLEKYTDDQVIDKLLSGEISTSDEYINNVLKDSTKGLDAVFSRNRALIGLDLAQNMLTFGKIGGLGKLSKYALKATKLDRVIDPVKDKLIDGLVGWQTRMALKSPVKAAIGSTAKKLAAYGLSAVSEGFEEGSQNVFNRDFLAGLYDEESTNMLRSYTSMLEANYRVGKVLAGLDTETELANDPDFYNEVKAGVALGLLMGSIGTIPKVTIGTAKELAANKIVRDLTVDNLAKKERFVKIETYADAFTKPGILNPIDQVVQTYENYKRSVLPKEQDSELTEEDIDNEIKLAKDVNRIVNNKDFNTMAKAAGFNKGSKEYNTFVGLATMANDDVKEATELYKESADKFNESLNKLIHPSTPVDAKQDIANRLTGINAQIAAIDDMITMIEAEPADGTRKFGVLDKSNPLAGVLLRNLRAEKPLLEKAAKTIAEDTEYQSDYMANSEEASDIANSYFTLAVATASKDQAEFNKRAYDGELVNKDGKLTSFRKADKETQSLVIDAIKKKVSDFLNKVDETQEIIKNNAKDFSSNPVDNTIPSETESTITTTPTSVDSTIPTEIKAPEIPSPVPTDVPEVLATPTSVGEEIADSILDSIETELADVEVPTEYDSLELESDENVDDSIIVEDGEFTSGTVEITDGSIDNEIELEDALDNGSVTVPATEDGEIDVTLYSDEVLNLGNSVDDMSIDDQLEALEKVADKVSQTLFYAPYGEKPLLPGYKSGKELAKFLSTPGILNRCKLRFFINPEYKTSYKKGDKSTYDDAPILLEVVDGNDKYLMALKTPKAAEDLVQGEAIERLRANRNAIIEAIENAKPGQIVVPTGIRASNGKYAVKTRTENGLTLSVQRPLSNISGMNVPANYHEITPENTDIAIGKGIIGRFVIENSRAQQVPGAGNSGNLYYVAKPSQTFSGETLPIQLNVSQFTKHRLLIRSLLNRFFGYSYGNTEYLTLYDEETEIEFKEIFEFVFNFGKKTLLNDSSDPRYGFLLEKQFGYNKDGKLVVGDKVYDPAELDDNKKEEIIEYVTTHQHWSVDRKTFWRTLSEALPSVAEYFDNSDKDEVTIGPGLKFTRADFDGNTTVMGWMIGNELITSNADDKLFKDPFYYYSGISVETSTNYSPVPFTGITTGNKYDIVFGGGRYFTVLNINGINVPFYLSSGLGGKEKVKSGKWYPFFGISKSGWLNKTTQEEINNYYGSDVLKQISEELDQKYPASEYSYSLEYGFYGMAYKSGTLGSKVQDFNFTDFEELVNKNFEPVERNAENANEKLRENINKVLFAIHGITVETSHSQQLAEGIEELSNPLPTSSESQQSEITITEDDSYKSEAIKQAEQGIDPLAALAGFNRLVEDVPEGSKPKKAEDPVTEWEKEWIRTNLGIDPEVKEEIAFALGRDQWAMGVCRLTAIELYQSAERGTGYHEAFHRVSLLLLDPKTRRKLYEDYKTVHKIDSKDDNYIEELIAEDFRRFMLDTQDPGYNFLRRLFNRFKYWVKTWFNKNDKAIYNIYRQITQGHFKNVKVNEPSVKEFIQRFKDTKGVAPFRYRGYEINSITNTQVEETVNALTSAVLLTNNVRFTGDLVNLDMSKIKVALDPKVTDNLVKNHTLTPSQAAVRNEIYEKFELFSKLVQDNLRKYKINVENIKENFDEEIENKAGGDYGDTGNALAQHTKSSLEISAKKNALAQVKVLVACLPNQVIQDGVLQTVKNPSTGLFTTVNFDKAWNTLSNELASCNTVQEILDRCNARGSVVPLLKTFANTLNELTKVTPSDTEATRIAKENLETQVLNTFRKNKSDFIFATAKNVVDENNNVTVDITVKNESANRERNQVLNGWAGNLVLNTKLVNVIDGEFVVDDNTVTEIDKVSDAFTKLFSKPDKLIPLQLKNYKNQIIKLLANIGLNIDIDTLTAVMSDYYYNPSEFESFKNMLKDTSIEGISFLFTNKMKDLKTIDATGNTRSGKFKAKIDNFYDNAGFASRLAEAYLVNNPSPEENAILTTDGKLFQVINEHNYLSDYTQDLDTDADAVDRLANVMYVGGENQNNGVKGSVIVDKLKRLHKTEKNGTKSREPKLKVQTLVGFRKDQSSDTGRSYTEISPLENYVMKMALVRQNRVLLPTMGDSVRYDVLTGSAVKGFSFTNAVAIRERDGKTALEFDSQILKRFIKYFTTELETILYNYDHLPTKPEDIIENYDTKNRNGYRLRYFNGITGLTAKPEVSINEILEDLEKSDKSKGDNSYSGAKAAIKGIIDNWNKKLSTADRERIMNNYLTEVFREELNYAQSIGLLTWNGSAFASIKNVAIPSQYISSVKTSRPQINNSEYADQIAMIDIMMSYFANSVSSIIEFGKIYTKDPAYYKNPTDMIKRLREVLSTGVVPRTDYPNNPEMNDFKEFTVGTLRDNEIVSRQIEDIKKSAARSYAFNLLQQQGFTEEQAIEALDNGKADPKVIDQANAMADARFNGYTKVNQTDATVLISPEGYKQLVRRINGWTPEVAKAFAVLNDTSILTDKNASLYHESLNTLIQPLKVMFFGERDNVDLRRSVPIFDKMALFPVFPVFATGDMKHVYDRMVDEKNPIHMLAFESAVKVGQDSKTALYKDGQINVDGLKSIVTHKQPLNRFRRQLVTDPHDAHHEQMFVSQAQKAAMLNIRPNNTYTTPEGEKVKGSALYRNIFDMIDELTIRGRQAVDKKLGVTEDENGNLTLDKTKLNETLKASAEASHMDQNTLDGLTPDANGRTSPLSGMSNNAWMESSIISLHNKEIIDVNTAGGMFIQMSSVAYNDLTVRKDGGVRDLKFDTKDGTIECVVSINLLKTIIPDYDKKSFKESKDWLIKAGIIGRDSAAMAMGYRIPAQGPSSVAALKVVDVYPENIGDTITLPDEWTALTGSDFDVDKLFVARYNFDKNGKKAKYYTKDEYTQSLREKHPDWDDEKISLETYKKYSGKTDREANSKEAIQNRLLDMYIASISNPLQYSESRQPLDAVTSYLTDKVLGDIDKLQKSKQGASRLQLTTATPGFQNRTKADLIAGKTNLGAFALSNSHHMLAQAVALVTQGHKSINHLHINKLNGIYSQDPNFHDKQTIVTLISDWISAMINAHVDVAKDPYINRLNVRKFTINVTNYLLRAGKGESTFYFLSQKILRDIADEFEALSGYYGVEDAIGGAAYAAKSKVENKYKQALIDRFGLSLPEIKKRITKLTSSPEFNAFDIKMLQKFMPEENTANWYIQQLAILETYEAIEPSARALSENTKLSQIDTKKFGNNYALQQNFLMKMAEFAQTDKVFADPLSVIRHTFLRQKLFDALIRPRQYMSKVLLRTTPEFENKRRKLYQITGRHMMSSDKYVNDITRMMEASYKAKFWMQYAADNGLKVASLFAGENSVPRRLYKIKQMIQSQPELGLLNSDGSFANILLDSISMMLKTDKHDMKLPDFIQFKHNKSDDHNLDDHLIRAWEELLELNAANETLQPQVDAIKTFARDLAIYAFFTSGDAFGKNNIFKYVPESFRESSGYYDYIRKLEAEPSEMLTKISEEDVIRNLWWNDEVIPAHNIFNEKYEETDRGIEPTYSINSWYIPSNITVKKGKDELNVPQILSLNKGKVIGKNDKGQILYQPYVKVDFGSKNNPLTTFVYKFVGIRDTEMLDKDGNPKLTKDGKSITVQKPIYSLITKKGIKHKGKVLVEPSGKIKSLLSVNNVLELPNNWFELNGAKYGIEPNLSLVSAVEAGYTGEIEYLTSKLFDTKFLDETIDEEDLLEDVNQDLASDEKEATQSESNDPADSTEVNTSFPSTINIYAGTGENAELSNFAERPFTFDGFTFRNVESAFQAKKLDYSNLYTPVDKNGFSLGEYTDEGFEILETLQKTSGVQARKIGRTVIKGLNVDSWNKDSSIIMHTLIYESFKQNPDAARKLLATGNATLTHTQDKSKWGTEFPRILMKVREELREEIKEELEQIANQTPKSELNTTAVTDAKLAQEFEQFVAETSTWYDEQDVKSVQKELSELPKAKSTPSFTFADGTKIDTPFELNDQQKFALLELEKFYNSSESFFSLQGYAGTGKTTIMKIFDAYLKKKKDKPLYLAPTHKANSVTKASNPEASTSTVHSVLGLVPEYDMASEKFDASKMKFNDPGEIGIEPETVVILDECSMVPDELADFICSAIEETQSKIIFLGDPAQLSPVGQNKLSKTFEMNSKVELTKVERTGDNSILKEATNLREGKTLSYQTELNQKGDGIMFTKNANTVAIYLKSILNSDEFKNNPLHFRVLSGVNASIPVYNNLIRTLLYGKDAPFLVEGELLMGYSNEQKNRKGSKRPYNIMNSGDYSVVKVGESITKEVPHTDGLEVKGRMVLLHEVTSQYPINVFILDPSTSAKTIRAIKLTIDDMWATYRRLNSEGRRGEAVEQLTKINEIQNSFSTMKDIIDEETGRLIRKKTFDYGYTHTVHKSQGATYDKVLVLGDSFNVFDRNTQQQLKYVAITRAKQQVMYIAPTSSSVNPQALSEVTKEKWAEIQERVNKCK